MSAAVPSCAQHPSTRISARSASASAALDILLDDQDRDAGGPDLGELGEHLRQHFRRQSGGRLVEHQEARLGDQRARHREHLALPAREAARREMALPGKVGKQREHRRDLASPRGPGQKIGGKAQIVGNRHQGEDVLGLRYEAQAAAHELMRMGRRDVMSVERDGAAEFRNQARDRLDQGRFAGAIRSEDGEDLAGPDPKADAPHDRSTGFVARPQVIDGEDRRAHGTAPPR